MTYVKQTLAPGEDILKRANFNWTYSVGPFFWFFLGIAPAVYLGITQLTGELPGDPNILYGLSAVPGVIGLGILLGHFVHLQTTEIVVTSFRFVYKTGLVSRQTKEVSLNKIEEINLQQTILGRVFGYGSLVLRGTGVGVIELPNIDNPVQLRRVIEGAKASLKEDGAGNILSAVHVEDEEPDMGAVLAATPAIEPVTAEKPRRRRKAHRQSPQEAVAKAVRQPLRPQAKRTAEAIQERQPPKRKPRPKATPPQRTAAAPEGRPMRRVKPAPASAAEAPRGEGPRKAPVKRAPAAPTAEQQPPRRRRAEGPQAPRRRPRPVQTGGGRTPGGKLR